MLAFWVLCTMASLYFVSLWQIYWVALPVICWLVMVSGQYFDSSKDFIAEHLLTIGTSLSLVGIRGMLYIAWYDILYASLIVMISTMIGMIWAVYTQTHRQKQIQVWLAVSSLLVMISRNSVTDLPWRLISALILCMVRGALSLVLRVMDRKQYTWQRIIIWSVLIVHIIMIYADMGMIWYTMSMIFWTWLIFVHRQLIYIPQKKESDIRALIKWHTLHEIRSLQNERWTPYVQHLTTSHYVSLSFGAIAIVLWAYGQTIYQLINWSNQMWLLLIILMVMTYITAIWRRFEYQESILGWLWYAYVYLLIAISPISALASVIVAACWYILNSTLLMHLHEIIHQKLSKQIYKQRFGINTVWAILAGLGCLVIWAHPLLILTSIVLFAGIASIMTSYNRKFISHI